MFGTPGRTSTTPMVVTARPSPPRTTSSRLFVAYSAAVKKASFRRSMGVVPAWSGWPTKVRRKRRIPTMPSTTPIGTSSVSSQGPCSMWSSTYAAISRGSRRAVGAAARSNPARRIASGNGSPVGSASRSARVRSSEPVSAREPKNP